MSSISDSDSQSSSPSSTSHNVPLARGSACATCRRRKVKCDGLAPCTPCTNSQRDCIFVPKKKLPGPPTAAALSTKLALLQERFNELATAFQQELVAPENADGHMPGFSYLGLEPDQNRSNAASKNTAARNPSLADEIPTADRDILLSALFKNRHRCFFAMTPEKFHEAMSRPNPAQRPHPALVHAMLLLGKAFASSIPELTPSGRNRRVVHLPGSLPSSELLLIQTQAYLTESLAQVDRLVDYFSATGLLTHWYFLQGRLQEAQYLSANTSRLLIGARLHQIDVTFLKHLSDEQLGQPANLPWDITLLGRPKSSEEIAFRIEIFWQSFYHDKILSLVTGLPSAYEDTVDGRVTTIWPRSLAAFNAGATFHDGSLGSVQELLAEYPHVVSTDRPPTMFAMIVQGITFVDRATRISSGIQASPHLWETDATSRTVSQLQSAVESFSKSVPLDANDLDPDQLLAGTEDREYVKHSLLAYIWVMICVSKIHLYRALEALELQVASTSTLHETRVAVARLAVDVVRGFFAEPPSHTQNQGLAQLTRVNIEHNAIFGFLLTSIALVLIDEIKFIEYDLAYVAALEGSSENNLVPHLEDIEGYWVTVREVMQACANYFPILAVQVSKLDELRSN